MTALPTAEGVIVVFARLPPMVNGSAKMLRDLLFPFFSGGAYLVLRAAFFSSPPSIRLLSPPRSTAF